MATINSTTTHTLTTTELKTLRAGMKTALSTNKGTPTERELWNSLAQIALGEEIGEGLTDAMFGFLSPGGPQKETPKPATSPH